MRTAKTQDAQADLSLRFVGFVRRRLICLFKVLQKICTLIKSKNMYIKDFEIVGTLLNLSKTYL